MKYKKYMGVGGGGVEKKNNTKGKFAREKKKEN